MKTQVQKISPHLWFDKEAKEAAEFYCVVFPDSKITNIAILHDTPSGDVDTITFELWGQKFMAISAGPLFKFNPSVSFFVNFDRRGKKMRARSLMRCGRNCRRAERLSCRSTSTRSASDTAGSRTNMACRGN